MQWAAVTTHLELTRVPEFGKLLKVKRIEKMIEPPQKNALLD